MHAGNDIVDAAVAAHGGDDVEALVGALACQFGAVVYALGVAHFVVIKVQVQVVLEQAFYLFLSSNPRDGVDDGEQSFFHNTEFQRVSWLLISRRLYCCTTALSSCMLPLPSSLSCERTATPSGVSSW